VSALKNLYLVTDDGRTWSCTRGDYTPDSEHPLHLYQEFCPITRWWRAGWSRTTSATPSPTRHIR
jgi:hypothetical protein